MKAQLCCDTAFAKNLTHLALTQQSGFTFRFADDEAAIVEAGTVLLEPVGDLALVIDW